MKCVKINVRKQYLRFNFNLPNPLKSYIKVELDFKDMKRWVFKGLSYPDIDLQELGKKGKFCVNVSIGDRDLKPGSPEYNRPVTTRHFVAQCSLVKK
jgi:hypothetical protein